MKKKTAAAPDSYVRVPGFAELLSGVHLPAEVWAVFAQCDSPRRPSEIARLARLDEEVVASALRRLSRRHLVQKHALDWNAYLASQGAPATAPAAAPMAPPHAPVTPAPATPTGLAPEPAAEPPPAFSPAPAAAPAPRSSASPELVSFVLTNLAASEARRRDAHNVLALYIGRAQPAAPVLVA